MKTPKPLVVGEFGATYYGMPPRVFKYFGDKVFESYAGRNEALAVDLYKNVTEMVKPNIAYFSPSEVCWFGIEHLNFGYSDFSRLPTNNDGIFAGKDYQEGKPGYQLERIPPYIFTVNAGIDKNLPFMKPLAHYLALKAALAGKPCPWDKYEEISKDVEQRPFKAPAAEALPEAKFAEAYFIGNPEGKLAKQLRKFGVILSDKEGTSNFVIVDAENITEEQAAKLKSKIIPALSKKENSALVCMSANSAPNAVLMSVLGKGLETYNFTSTSMLKGNDEAWAKRFNLADLYFVASKAGKSEILKTSFAGDFLKGASVIFKASNVDWSLFDASEVSKCSQVVLYESLKKPLGAGLISKPLGKGKLYMSALNYELDSKHAVTFFKSVFRMMGLATVKGEAGTDTKAGSHDLLMDGPID